jgi:ribosomal protein L32
MLVLLSFSYSLLAAVPKNDTSFSKCCSLSKLMEDSILHMVSGMSACANCSNMMRATTLKLEL